MPDIAVFITIEYPINNAFHCKILIRAQNHEALIRLIEYDVFGDHLGYMAGIQEYLCELIQTGYISIIFISPEKCLFEVLVPIVSIVLGIYAIADDENLDVLKKSASSRE